jgi:hypothetical protein
LPKAASNKIDIAVGPGRVFFLDKGPLAALR